MIDLREFVPEDRDQILIWRNLPEITKYMYSDHIITPEEHVKWFEKVLQDNSKRYWMILLDGVGVGVANIVDIDLLNRQCAWAFYLAEPQTRGRGVGSYVEYFVLNYVFAELQLNKLNCEVLTFNTTVIKMHEKFGFKQEGLFRQHVFKEGVFHDVVRLAILRDEWMQIKDTLEAKLFRDKRQ